MSGILSLSSVWWPSLAARFAVTSFAFLLACSGADGLSAEDNPDVEGLEGEWFKSGYFQLWGRAGEDMGSSRTRPNRVEGVVVLYADPEAVRVPWGHGARERDFCGELWVAPPRDGQLSVLGFLARFGARLIHSGGDALSAEFRFANSELAFSEAVKLEGEITSERVDASVLRHVLEGDLWLPEGLSSPFVVQPVVVSLRLALASS